MLCETYIFAFRTNIKPTDNLMNEYHDTEPIPEFKSCGFLLMKSDKSFLLMKHAHRYDLPKGHMEQGETEQQTAIRELHEETGVESIDIDIDPKFRFEEVYYPIYKRLGNKKVKKTLVVFLAKLKFDSVKIITTEHENFEWFSWTVPLTPIQTETIDPLLVAVYKYLNEDS